MSERLNVGRLFDPAAFLETTAKGRTVVAYRKGAVLFGQGDAADAVFYVKSGKVKVTVVSAHGKEAVIGILGVDEFLGEGCLIGQPKRLSTATAMTDCVTMRVDKAEIIRVLHDEPAFSQMFVSHILARSARFEEDLVDQLFNSTEKKARSDTAVVGQLRQGRQARTHHRENHSGDACGDDRNDPLAREPFHEQVPPAGLHRLQRPSGSP
jgi:CRP-like cAMP-binding protein